MIQLYIGKLSPDVLEDSLKVFISQAGNVDSVEIIKDLQTGESRGYAVARITDEQVANEAILRFNNTVFAGDTLQLSRMPLTLPGEMAFRDWLHRNSKEVLNAIGVKKGQALLDYGCGPGIFSIASAELIGETGRVYALDVRIRAVERVKNDADSAGLKNVKTILQKESSISTGFTDASIDIILVYDVLHDIQDKQGLLMELDRILKPEGLLSLFPMHLGNEAIMKVMKEYGKLHLRDSYYPTKCQSPSTILNFVKNF